VNGTGHETHQLEQLLVIYREYSHHAPIYNEASMVYNHMFMWLCIIPNGKAPSKWLRAYLMNHFGGLNRFKEMWIASCKSLFGSGWCWLVENDGHPEIINSVNAGNPYARDGLSPIMVIDLWEHAYFHDYGTNREAYVVNWLKAVNWELIEVMIKRVERQTHVSPNPEYLNESYDPIGQKLEDKITPHTDNPFAIMQGERQSEFGETEVIKVKPLWYEPRIETYAKPVPYKKMSRRYEPKVDTVTTDTYKNMSQFVRKKL